MQADPVPLFDGSAPSSFHVAIIMDGNGRWAHARGLPRTAGHKRGAESVRRVVEAAPELGISHLTLFGFSSENWKRPEGEISDLMGLLRLYLRNEIRDLKRNGVRLRVIGRRERFSRDIVALIEDGESDTRDNDRLHLTIALNYGGRQEIADAARALAREVAAGRLDPEAIDEEVLGQRLLTDDLPDPDVLVRTSGEQRISNFLLWQIAYSELVFSPVLWPEFSRDDLAAAVADFHQRERRFGGV
ncbi:isoprenyl transferase [Rhodospirillum rubrum]|uniref:Isoprenyl transferase n=1 Tax=Rhodospirillum rubrum (strain ATCC 11170 / ATH 1.1.1 / DSM 467 / LMG 4362 / NCIMB 8255 / S1) TaxID=269796 RepID=Q2RU05_RHORT|nr:isoprenyl transferase [Rhodospirillum rubrum]ABC22390.1 Undecaprenyl pyrophosphate synthetase [Rhodospirillum rubrum ATCC 11170]AEO48107.1 undecaprenyl pyrophosphate synthetase [Rhodospirillum rubrum F11]MBK5953971.1 di-trans,poly-cis-decaprenylcistransferase [Rhodospirillum rubrum]QXG82026.1 isoprenyl transferase [Rhodospirillum rubrum]HAP99833.1 isoprenyl transferase [Rhodospirillum rubrum]